MWAHWTTTSRAASSALRKSTLADGMDADVARTVEDAIHRYEAPGREGA